MELISCLFIDKVNFYGLPAGAEFIESLFSEYVWWYLVMFVTFLGQTLFKTAGIYVDWRENDGGTARQMVQWKFGRDECSRGEYTLNTRGKMFICQCFYCLICLLVVSKLRIFKNVSYQKNFMIEMKKV